MKPLKERIEVEQAYDNGKDVDWISLRDADPTRWRALNDAKETVVFGWDRFNYRIKPEPMEFIISIFYTGTAIVEP